MPYGIGLDCGTTSVGSAIIELDEHEEPFRIIRLGSRIFTAAENPKTGASLALPRRQKRSMRRRLRRHRHRIERIKNLLIASDILTETELDRLFIGKLSDIYELRTQALDRKLNASEFSRVLIHLAQRRGFKSNRKTAAQDEEAGILLSAVSENSALMTEKGYRTVGEMMYKDEKFSQNKRNKGENYSNTVSRDMIEAEIHTIFQRQRDFDNQHADTAFEDQYTEIVLSQRSFEEGPGGNSKYGGNQIERMMGNCTLIPGEKRAVKAAYSFQLFTLWQKINNIRIITNGESRALTAEERFLIFTMAHSKENLKYSDIRIKLSLTDEERFNLNYRSGIEEAEKQSFNYLKAYHSIRKVLNKVSKNRIKDYSLETLDEIGYIFTVYKNDEKITEALNALGLESQDTEALLTLDNFKKVGHISVKACRQLLPFLEQGMKYNEACDAAGFNFKAHNSEKSKFLPGYSEEFADLRNPVVKRTVSQTIKVINAIVREQNESPVYINIELARELSKTFDERNKIIKNIENNQNANERIMERLRNEYHLMNPSGQDLIKLKLWEEQDGICPYSRQPILIDKLFAEGYAEIDHIFPFSISFDDSYKNKVLVLAKENRNKGNRLPLQYLTGKDRDDYIVWVNTHVNNYRKKQLLLKERITEEDRENMKQRSLQDTQYLSSFLYNYINDHMEFAPSTTGRKKRVTAVNGAVTAYIRKRWGIRKIREDGDLHHAADAAVIACITNKMIKRISDYSRHNELLYSDGDILPDDVDPETGEVFDRFPLPWPTFRKELEIRLMNDPKRYLEEIHLPNYSSDDIEKVTPCFVSRMPTRKTKGAAHEDTVRSAKLLEEGKTISKKPLIKLKLKNGEIENYYNPSSDTLLYNALKERLIRFNGDAKAAFEEPFYKPTASGEPGPLVRSVKICEASSLTVPVHNKTGVANNDSMVRIDIFFVEGEGYYFIPIYVADTVKKTLPNKAVVQNKSYAQWKEMSDKNFLFSLYPNDLVLVRANDRKVMSLKQKNSTLPAKYEFVEQLLYYSKAAISTGSITVETHDNTYIISNLGIKTLASLEKYEVDALGNYHKVSREQRRGFGE